MLKPAPFRVRGCSGNPWPILMGKDCSEKPGADS